MHNLHLVFGACKQKTIKFGAPHKARGDFSRAIACVRLLTD